MRPYYEDDLTTLYHGDCADVLPNISGVDLFVTSPPYNLGVTTGGGLYASGKWKAARGSQGIGYSDHDDAMDYASYEEWQRDCLRLMWNSLSDQGAIFYNHKPRIQARELWTPLALNPDLPVRQIVVWARSGGMNFAPTHYLPTHEWVVIFAKPEWRLSSQGASGVGDVWHITQEANPDHPAPFPIGLPARAIETAKPSLVADAFAGSGTTLRAAKDAGVRSVGCEKSERYCELAAKRLAQDTLFGASA